jgi:hypothetical protein
MELLPILVLTVLGFTTGMDPALALLIMTRTGALHFRSACAHILSRFVSTAQGSWYSIMIPRLVSGPWICAKERRLGHPDRMMIVEAVIRAEITMPGRSCPVWCYKMSEDRKMSLMNPTDPPPDGPQWVTPSHMRARMGGRL